MVCTGLLTGLLLFSLFSSVVPAEEVDINTLHKIVRFFETNYKPAEKTDSGDGAQYTVAINIPAEQCGANFNENTFLIKDDKERVKNDLNDKKKRLYQGEQMVAARPKGRKHSERALLMCDDSSQAVAPVQNLLNKEKDGCVVFYTYNSPCLDLCLNQAKDDNEQKREKDQRDKKRNNVIPAVKTCILKSLSILTNHPGPKAFVFSRIYRMDIDNTELASALQEVAKMVDLYKCGTNSCIKCLDKNIFNNQCLS